MTPRRAGLTASSASYISARPRGAEARFAPGGAAPLYDATDADQAWLAETNAGRPAHEHLRERQLELQAGLRQAVDDVLPHEPLQGRQGHGVAALRARHGVRPEARHPLLPEPLDAGRLPVLVAGDGLEPERLDLAPADAVALGLALVVVRPREDQEEVVLVARRVELHAVAVRRVVPASPLLLAVPGEVVDGAAVHEALAQLALAAGREPHARAALRAACLRPAGPLL